MKEIEWREKEKKIDEYLLRENTDNNQIPKIIFVVPYRDREQQYRFFHKQMTKILTNYHC